MPKETITHAQVIELFTAIKEYSQQQAGQTENTAGDGIAAENTLPKTIAQTVVLNSMAACHNSKEVFSNIARSCNSLIDYITKNIRGDELNTSVEISFIERIIGFMIQGNEDAKKQILNITNTYVAEVNKPPTAPSSPRPGSNK